MSFNELADEILLKIFNFLLPDRSSFIEFSLLNKRINYVSLSISNMLITKQQWTHHRPLKFDMLRFFDHCLTEKPYNYAKHRRPMNYFSINTSDNDEFIDKAIRSILNLKYFNVSGIAFDSMNVVTSTKKLYDLQNETFHNEIYTMKISAIVELQISDCFLSVEWLTNLLNLFPNVKYLTLQRVEFDESHINRQYFSLYDIPIPPGIILNRLKILDRRHMINDLTLEYFTKGLPAIQLDLSFSQQIVFQTRICQRFYPDLSKQSKASKEIFSWFGIRKYLIENQSIVKVLRIQQTMVSPNIVAEILNDPRLKELFVIANNCDLLRDPKDIAKMNRMIVDQSNLRRVILQ